MCLFWGGFGFATGAARDGVGLGRLARSCRPRAANDLHRLYGAKELCDRRWCPFALTSGRNVVSWIGRHSQHKDRHHAQPRTFHRQRLASGTSSACDYPLYLSVSPVCVASSSSVSPGMIKPACSSAAISRPSLTMSLPVKLCFDAPCQRDPPMLWSEEIPKLAISAMTKSARPFASSLARTRRRPRRGRKLMPQPLKYRTSEGEASGCEHSNCAGKTLRRDEVRQTRRLNLGHAPQRATLERRRVQCGRQLRRALLGGLV